MYRAEALSLTEIVTLDTKSRQALDTLQRVCVAPFQHPRPPARLCADRGRPVVELGRRERDSAAVSAGAGSRDLHCAYFVNFGQAASRPCWRPRSHHDPCCCEDSPLKYGECDKDGRPGSGSKLYYIKPWAMCWPSDHPKRPGPDLLSLGAAKLHVNLKHTNFTTC